MPLTALSFAQSSVHCSRKLPQAGKGLFPQIDVVSVSLTLVTTSHWGMLWGHLWVIRNTKSTGSMKDIWIPPHHPGIQRQLHHPTRMRRKEQVVSWNMHKQSNGLLSEKPPRAETNARPTQNGKEKNQFLFCPEVYEHADPSSVLPGELFSFTPSQCLPKKKK